MKGSREMTGMAVIGATMSVLFLALAAMLIIPLMMGAIGLAFVLRKPIRQAFLRARGRDASEVVLEGEWVVLDVRQKIEAVRRPMQ